MRILATAIVCAAITAGQEPAPERIVDGVTRPRLLSKVEPSYSEEARKAKLEGVVNLQAIISTAGVAHDCKVTQSLGLGLDETAQRAVSQWRFAPGTKNGIPVPVIVTVQVNFRLLTNNTSPPWHLSRASFDTPEGAIRPRVTSTDFPREKPRGHGTVSLTFTINEKGQPRDLNVDQSDSPLEQQIIAAAKKWRFTPATKDGAPVAVQATFEFEARRVF